VHFCSAAVVTHAGCIASGMGRAFTRVCLSVGPRSKRKTAWAINTKFGTHILYNSRSACIDPEVKRSKVKGQGHTVTKTVTVTWLLVMHAVTAVYCCCWRGSACPYDCQCFLVTLCVVEVNTLLVLWLQKDTVHKPRGCIRLDTSLQLKKTSNSSLFEVRDTSAFLC